MNPLSLDELVVLAAIGKKKVRADAAYAAANLAQSSKFDYRTALTLIDALITGGFLRKSKDGKSVEVTTEGYGAGLQALQTLEQLRGAVSMLGYGR